MSEAKEGPDYDLFIVLLIAGYIIFRIGACVGAIAERNSSPVQTAPPGMKIVWEAKLVEDKH